MNIQVYTSSDCLNRPHYVDNCKMKHWFHSVDFVHEEDSWTNISPYLLTNRGPFKNNRQAPIELDLEVSNRNWNAKGKLWSRDETSIKRQNKANKISLTTNDNARRLKPQTHAIMFSPRATNSRMDRRCNLGIVEDSVDNSPLTKRRDERINRAKPWINGLQSACKHSFETAGHCQYVTTTSKIKNDVKKKVIPSRRNASVRDADVKRRQRSNIRDAVGNERIFSETKRTNRLNECTWVMHQKEKINASEYSLNNHVIRMNNTDYASMTSKDLKNHTAINQNNSPRSHEFMDALSCGYESPKIMHTDNPKISLPEYNVPSAQNYEEGTREMINSKNTKRRGCGTGIQSTKSTLQRQDAHYREHSKTSKCHDAIDALSNHANVDNAGLAAITKKRSLFNASNAFKHAPLKEAPAALVTYTAAPRRGKIDVRNQDIESCRFAQDMTVNCDKEIDKKKASIQDKSMINKTNAISKDAFTSKLKTRENQVGRDNEHIKQRPARHTTEETLTLSEQADDEHCKTKRGDGRFRLPSEEDMALESNDSTYSSPLHVTSPPRFASRFHIKPINEEYVQERKRKIGRKIINYSMPLLFLKLNKDIEKRVKSMVDSYSKFVLRERCKENLENKDRSSTSCTLRHSMPTEDVGETEEENIRFKQDINQNVEEKSQENVCRQIRIDEETIKSLDAILKGNQDRQASWDTISDGQENYELLKNKHNRSLPKLSSFNEEGITDDQGDDYVPEQIYVSNRREDEKLIERSQFSYESSLNLQQSTQFTSLYPYGAECRGGQCRLSNGVDRAKYNCDEKQRINCMPRLQKNTQGQMQENSGISIENGEGINDDHGDDYVPEQIYLNNRKMDEKTIGRSRFSHEISLNLQQPTQFTSFNPYSAECKAEPCGIFNGADRAKYNCDEKQRIDCMPRLQKNMRNQMQENTGISIEKSSGGQLYRANNNGDKRNKKSKECVRKSSGVRNDDNSTLWFPKLNHSSQLAQIIEDIPVAKRKSSWKECYQSGKQPGKKYFSNGGEHRYVTVKDNLQKDEIMQETGEIPDKPASLHQNKHARESSLSQQQTNRHVKNRNLYKDCINQTQFNRSPSLGSEVNENSPFVTPLSSPSPQLSKSTAQSFMSATSFSTPQRSNRKKPLLRPCSSLSNKTATRMVSDCLLESHTSPVLSEYNLIEKLNSGGDSSIRISTKRVRFSPNLKHIRSESDDTRSLLDSMTSTWNNDPSETQVPQQVGVIALETRHGDDGSPKINSILTLGSSNDPIDSLSAITGYSDMMDPAIVKIPVVSSNSSESTMRNIPDLDDTQRSDTFPISTSAIFLEGEKLQNNDREEWNNFQKQMYRLGTVDCNYSNKLLGVSSSVPCLSLTEETTNINSMDLSTSKSHSETLMFSACVESMIKAMHGMYKKKYAKDAKCPQAMGDKKVNLTKVKEKNKQISAWVQSCRSIRNSGKKSSIFSVNGKDVSIEKPEHANHKETSVLDNTQFYSIGTMTTASTDKQKEMSASPDVTHNLSSFEEILSFWENTSRKDNKKERTYEPKQAKRILRQKDTSRDLKTKETVTNEKDFKTTGKHDNISKANEYAIFNSERLPHKIIRKTKTDDSPINNQTRLNHDINKTTVRLVPNKRNDCTFLNQKTNPSRNINTDQEEPVKMGLGGGDQAPNKLLSRTKVPSRQRVTINDRPTIKPIDKKDNLDIGLDQAKHVWLEKDHINPNPPTINISTSKIDNRARVKSPNLEKRVKQTIQGSNPISVSKLYTKEMASDSDDMKNKPITFPSPQQPKKKNSTKKQATFKEWFTLRNDRADNFHNDDIYYCISGGLDTSPSYNSGDCATHTLTKISGRFVRPNVDKECDLHNAVPVIPIRQIYRPNIRHPCFNEYETTHKSVNDPFHTRHLRHDMKTRMFNNDISDDVRKFQYVRKAKDKRQQTRDRYQAPIYRTNDDVVRRNRNIAENTTPKRFSPIGNREFVKVFSLGNNTQSKHVCEMKTDNIGHSKRDLNPGKNLQLKNSRRTVTSGLKVGESPSITINGEDGKLMEHSNERKLGNKIKCVLESPVGSSDAKHQDTVTSDRIRSPSRVQKKEINRSTEQTWGFEGNDNLKNNLGLIQKEMHTVKGKHGSIIEAETKSIKRVACKNVQTTPCLEIKEENSTAQKQTMEKSPKKSGDHNKNDKKKNSNIQQTDGSNESHNNPCVVSAFSEDSALLIQSTFTVKSPMKKKFKNKGDIKKSSSDSDVIEKCTKISNVKTTKKRNEKRKKLVFSPKQAKRKSVKYQATSETSDNVTYTSTSLMDFVLKKEEDSKQNDRNKTFQNFHRKSNKELSYGKINIIQKETENKKGHDIEIVLAKSLPVKKFVTCILDGLNSTPPPSRVAATSQYTRLFRKSDVISHNDVCVTKENKMRGSKRNTHRRKLSTVDQKNRQMRTSHSMHRRVVSDETLSNISTLNEHIRQTVSREQITTMKVSSNCWNLNTREETNNDAMRSKGVYTIVDKTELNHKRQSHAQLLNGNVEDDSSSEHKNKSMRHRHNACEGDGQVPKYNRYQLETDVHKHSQLIDSSQLQLQYDNGEGDGVKTKEYRKSTNVTTDHTRLTSTRTPERNTSDEIQNSTIPSHNTNNPITNVRVLAPCSFSTKGKSVSAAITTGHGNANEKEIELTFTDTATGKTSKIWVESGCKEYNAWPNVSSSSNKIYVTFQVDSDNRVCPRQEHMEHDLNSLSEIKQRNVSNTHNDTDGQQLGKNTSYKNHDGCKCSDASEPCINCTWKKSVQFQLGCDESAPPNEKHDEKPRPHKATESETHLITTQKMNERTSGPRMTMPTQHTSNDSKKQYSGDFSQITTGQFGNNSYPQKTLQSQITSSNMDRMAKQNKNDLSPENRHPQIPSATPLHAQEIIYSCSPLAQYSPESYGTTFAPNTECFKDARSNKKSKYPPSIIPHNTQIQKASHQPLNGHEIIESVSPKKQSLSVTFSPDTRFSNDASSYRKSQYPTKAPEDTQSQMISHQPITGKEAMPSVLPITQYSPESSAVTFSPGTRYSKDASSDRKSKYSTKYLQDMQSQMASKQPITGHKRMPSVSPKTQYSTESFAETFSPDTRYSKNASSYRKSKYSTKYLQYRQSQMASQLPMTGHKRMPSVSPKTQYSPESFVETFSPGTRYSKNASSYRKAKYSRMAPQSAGIPNPRELPTDTNVAYTSVLPASPDSHNYQKTVTYKNKTNPQMYTQSQSTHNHRMSSQVKNKSDIREPMKFESTSDPQKSMPFKNTPVHGMDFKFQNIGTPDKGYYKMVSENTHNPLMPLIFKNSFSPLMPTQRKKIEMTSQCQNTLYPQMTMQCQNTSNSRIPMQFQNTFPPFQWAQPKPNLNFQISSTGKTNGFEKISPTTKMNCSPPALPSPQNICPQMPAITQNICPPSMTLTTKNIYPQMWPTNQNICPPLISPTTQNICSEQMICPPQTRSTVRNNCFRQMLPTSQNICRPRMESTTQNICAPQIPSTTQNICPNRMMSRCQNIWLSRPSSLRQKYNHLRKSPCFYKIRHSGMASPTQNYCDSRMMPTSNNHCPQMTTTHKGRNDKLPSSQNGLFQSPFPQNNDFIQRIENTVRSSGQLTSLMKTSRGDSGYATPTDEVTLSNPSSRSYQMLSNRENMEHRYRRSRSSHDQDVIGRENNKGNNANKEMTLIRSRLNPRSKTDRVAIIDLHTTPHKSPPDVHPNGSSERNKDFPQSCGQACIDTTRRTRNQHCHKNINNDHAQNRQLNLRAAVNKEWKEAYLHQTGFIRARDHRSPQQQSNTKAEPASPNDAWEAAILEKLKVVETAWNVEKNTTVDRRDSVVYTGSNKG